MKSPRWDLAVVKTLAASPGGLQILKTRALDFFADRRAAYAAAQEMIAGLTAGNFAKTVQLGLDEADEYGVRIRGRGW